MPARRRQPLALVLLKFTGEEATRMDDNQQNQPNDEQGAIGYIALWMMGVPASLLFFFFLMRGCT